MFGLNENVSIKIKDVRHLSWSASAVGVSARPYHALVYRIRGNAVFKIGNTEIKSNTNDVFFMPANCSYNVVYPEENEILAIHFESDSKEKADNLTADNPQIMYELFNKLKYIWNDKERRYCRALSVMCQILESMEIQQNSFISSMAKSFKNAVEYMDNNYSAEDFSIDKAVSFANMSDTYFRKLFAEKYGTTPLKYIIMKKLNYAEKLLSAGGYAVNEIAEKSGFRDVKYFSRAFKKQYGVPPSRLYLHTQGTMPSSF